MARGQRIAIVLGVMLAAVGGGAYYLLGVYLPGKALGTARAEVVAWESKYRTARECLVGKSPVTNSVAEAIAIHDLSPEPWSPKDCATQIGQLTRGVVDPTEIERVEVVWRDVDMAAVRFAQAFIRFSAPDHLEEASVHADAIDATVKEMDEIHARLRAAVDLPVAPLSLATEPLKQVPLLPIVLGSKQVTSLNSVTISNSEVAASAGLATTSVDLLHAPGATTIVMERGDAIRSTPDPAFGFAVDPQGPGIRFGKLDAAGHLGADAATVAVPGVRSVAFAIGTAEHAILGYVAGDKLQIGELTAGKLTPAAKPLADDVSPRIVRSKGRIAVTWEQELVQKAAVLDATALALPQPYDVPTEIRLDACLTADHAWFVHGEGLLGLPVTGTPVTHTIDDGAAQLLGCTPQSVLLHPHGTTKFIECTAAGCVGTELREAHPSAIGVVGGRVRQAIASRGKVIAVWGPSRVTMYAVSTPLTPLHAVANQSTTDVLARTAKGLVIVRLPGG